MFTQEELEAYIGAGVLSTAEGTVLTDLEETAVGLVERATGRVWDGQASATIKLEGGGGYELHIGLDFESVTEVAVRSALSDSWDVLDTDAYEYTAHGSQLLRVDGLEWPVGTALVKVTGLRGYATTAEVPGPIRQLVLDLVGWQFRIGRKLSLDDSGSPDVSKVAGWDRTVNLYKAPTYG